MTEPGITDRLATLFGETRTAQRVVVGALAAVNLVFPLLVFISGWPKPWRAFDGEESPINWFSSAQCVVVACIALAVWGVTRLGRANGTEPIPRSWPWAVFCLGFVAMALDEQFTFHERIREEFLKPHGVLTHVHGLLPGDVVLVAYVVVGLALSYFLIAELRQSRTSLVLFGIGLVLIAVSATQDALDLPFLYRPNVARARTILEELAEVWAQLAMATAFLGLFFLKLRRVLRVSDVSPGPAS